jgi:hypothetical protein
LDEDNMVNEKINSSNMTLKDLLNTYEDHARVIT